MIQLLQWFIITISRGKAVLWVSSCRLREFCLTTVPSSLLIMDLNLHPALCWKCCTTKTEANLSLNINIKGFGFCWLFFFSSSSCHSTELAPCGYAKQKMNFPLLSLLIKASKLSSGKEVADLCRNNAGLRRFNKNLPCSCSLK